MSKEYLEALENLKELGYLIDEVSGLTKYVYEYDDSFDSRLEYICEQIGKIKNKLQPALQKLEAIDNANPSEALECLEKLVDKSYIFNGCYESIISREEAQENNEEVDELASTIKQALLKAQEQEKALKIIFEKNVDIRNLKHYIEVYSDDVALKVYNGFHNKDEELTQEEFDILKRYCENE